MSKLKLVWRSYVFPQRENTISFLQQKQPMGDRAAGEGHVYSTLEGRHVAPVKLMQTENKEGILSRKL